MLSIPEIARDQVWYKQPSFYNFNFSIPNKSASPLERVVLEGISSKMTSVQGHKRSCWERPSVAPFVAPFIAFPDSFPSSKSDDKLSNQLARLLETKPLVNAFAAAINVPKYSEDDMQWIFKTVLEAWAPIPAPVPAPISAPVVSKVPREKLKACSPDIYREKFHIDCYNFCQQCEDYFAITGAIGPTRISFVVSFLQDQISFR